MGRASVDMLLDVVLERGDRLPFRDMPVELVVRQSTGVAPQRDAEPQQRRDALSA